MYTEFQYNPFYSNNKFIIFRRKDGTYLCIQNHPHWCVSPYTFQASLIKTVYSRIIPANTEKFLSGSFPGQSRGDQSAKSHSRRPKGTKIEAESWGGIIGEGQSLHQLGGHWLFAVFTTKKASPEQKVSTVNDSSRPTIFISVVLGIHKVGLYVDFDSASRPYGFCTWMQVWPAHSWQVCKITC